ncbi:MAG TPA: hypothetical protein PKK43_09475, partial [Spirochaetota bacterium]|nr:hypothetical protein [Spirochaetota bacterium]
NNNGGTGYGGEGDNSIDGIGSSAKFDTPGMVTCDGSGNLYVADYKNRCIRIVNTTTGSVKTVAGSTSNYVEKDGIGVNAGFEFPMGICYNASTLYVSEASVYHTIRKISIPDYRVLTIAGHDSGFSDGSPLSARFFTPFDLVYAGDQLYITDYSNNRIRVYTPFSVSTFTTAVSSPIGITTDNTNLYVTDSHEIHKIVISSGAISVIAGSPSSGITDGTGISAYFNTPSGIAYANGHLYVADTGNHAIRDIDISSRNVSLFTGSVSEAGTANGVGTAARFYSPYGICTDGSYLYVTDYTNNNIRKINIATKEVTRLAGAN